MFHVYLSNGCFLKTKRCRTSAQLKLMSRLRNSSKWSSCAPQIITAKRQPSDDWHVTNQDAANKMDFKSATATQRCRSQDGSMQFLCLVISCLILSSSAAGESEESQQESQSATTSSSHKQQKANQGFRLISFESVEKDIALGLNYLMPFVEVPVKRKRNAPPRVSSSTQLFSLQKIQSIFYECLKLTWLGLRLFKVWNNLWKIFLWVF